MQSSGPVPNGQAPIHTCDRDLAFGSRDQQIVFGLIEDNHLIIETEEAPKIVDGVSRSPVSTNADRVGMAGSDAEIIEGHDVDSPCFCADDHLRARPPGDASDGVHTNLMGHLL